MTGSPSRASASPRWTCGRRSAPAPLAARCAGSPSRAPRSSTRWWRWRPGRASGAGGRGGLPAIEVLLRLNPDVQPETHAGLAVGRGSSKFGMTETELTAAVASLRLDGPVAPRGIHLHVGSQLGAVDAWRDAVRRGLAVLALLRAGCRTSTRSTLAAGSPLATPARCRRPPGSRAELPALLEAIPVRPAARAAGRGARAVPRRPRWVDRRNGAACPRARRRGAGRGARRRDDGAHPADAVRGGAPGRGADVARRGGQRWRGPGAAGRAPSPVRLDGPICESTDTFGRYDLPPLRRGDLVAIGETGAYAASMASTYNGRPAAPQVLLEEDGALTLGRRRGRTGPAGLSARMRAS